MLGIQRNSTGRAGENEGERDNQLKRSSEGRKGQQCDSETKEKPKRPGSKKGLDASSETRAWKMEKARGKGREGREREGRNEAGIGMAKRNTVDAGHSARGFRKAPKCVARSVAPRRRVTRVEAGCAATRDCAVAMSCSMGSPLRSGPELDCFGSKSLAGPVCMLQKRPVCMSLCLLGERCTWSTQHAVPSR
eukprot:6212236-Pleurochrysis_carterae.AAC.1